MGVRIKGMDMPRNCNECVFTGRADCMGVYEPVCIIKQGLIIHAVKSKGRPKWCPLAEAEGKETNDDD